MIFKRLELNKILYNKTMQTQNKNTTYKTLRRTFTKQPTMTSQVSHFDVHCGMLGPELLDSGAVEGVAVGEVEEGEV